MLKAVIFDLDGTLLPMNEDKFTKGYFSLLCKKLSKFGYEPNELINAVWQGTKSMVMNDGSKTNEEVFWNVFCNKYGQKGLEDKSLFDDFYIKEFLQTKLTTPFELTGKIYTYNVIRQKKNCKDFKISLYSFFFCL